MIEVRKRVKGAGLVDTYSDAADAEADKAQQLRLLAALGAWDLALRRDELAAWCIQGTRGSIYTSGDGKTWVAHISLGPPLVGGVRQAGHLLHRHHGRRRRGMCPAAWPAGPGQAEVIREALGLRKRAEISTEQRSRLRELAKAFGFKSKHHGEAVSGARIGGNEAA